MTHPEWFLSPIKVNLFLHIMGRRADGYHLLQTLFQFLDKGDDIRFELLENGAIERIDHHDFPLPVEDLCVEAARRLRNLSDDTKRGVKIHLKKRIPPGTGLGAGSSNAATVLLVLNRLWEINLPITKLQEIGVDLGADIPVFVHGQATWAEGVGDQFTPCSPPTGWIVVALPDARVSTADTFSNPRLVRNHQPVSFKDYLEGRTGNDLESLIAESHPEIGEALTFLQQFGNARMSGTGSAVFVCVDSREIAQDVLQALPANIDGLIARRLNKSPLHELLNS